MRLLTSTLALCTWLFASGPASAQTADPTAALQQRYSDWMQAYWRSDGATMDKMETDDLTLIFQDGTVWSKQAHRVESLEGREPLPYTHTLEQVRARILGDVAVLTGVQNHVNPKDGIKARIAFTSVWQRNGGEWKVWSAHWSDVPEKK